MRPLFGLACVLVLLVPATAAEARMRHRLRGTPIIAQDPAVRVTRNGNVVAPPDVIPRRNRNGRVPVRYHRDPGTPEQSMCRADGAAACRWHALPR